MNSTHYNIIIIGSGMAGLSAAQYLINNGITDLIVLEAQNYIGGRILSKQFGLGVVELGANWIHGTNQANCVFNLANKYELIDVPLQISDRKKGAFVHSSGLAVDQHLCEHIYEQIKQIENEATKLPHQPNGQTYQQFCDQKFEQILEKYSDVSEQNVVKSVYNYFKNYMSFHAGDNINLVSDWGYGAYNEIPNDIPVSGGFSQLINCLAEDIGKEKILLNHQVIEIDYGFRPIRVTINTNGNEKQILTAYHVIITVSLGVLKVYHKQLFQPELPLKKMDAINRMGFGRVAKIFLRYSKPFWSPGTLKCLKFIRDDNHFKVGEHWSFRINGFEELTANPNVIQAWVSGSETEQLELNENHYIIEICTQLLRQFTGDPTLPRPDSVIKTNWCTNPFIRGSYSFPTVQTLDDDYGAISESIPSNEEPRLLFAGEATHHCYFSTVHGARITGLREAIKLVNLINKKIRDK